MICVLSVNRNQKRLTFFFVTALIHSLEKFWTILFAFEKTIQVELTLKDILIGVFRPECPLLKKCPLPNTYWENLLMELQKE